MEAEAVPSPAATSGRSSSLLVLPAAALMGASALALELLWIRALGRGVGTSHEALAAVAGIFLGGLGLGSALGARRAVQSEHPAMTAALALLAAGVIAWIAPWYVGWVPSLHDGLLDALGLEGDGGAGAAFLLVLPLVLPASLLFGLAFPYLVRARTMHVRHIGARTGWIYALDTAGAVVGVIGSVLLLEHYGETLTMRLAGAAAMGAALLLLLGQRPLPHGSGPPAAATLGRASAAGGEGIALLLSGAAALMAQLAWFRMLQPLAGAHLWGVALLLAPILLLMALGSAFGGWLSDRVRRSETLLPVLLVLSGVGIYLSLPLAGDAPLALVHGGVGGDRIWSLLEVFLVTTGPAVFFLGAALPAAVRVRADASGTAADAAGRIYAWNALGALLGSILAGWGLLPHLGAERVLALAGALPLIAAAGLRWRLPGGGRAPAAALHLAPLLVLLVPGMMGRLLSSAPTLPEVVAARKPLPPGCTLHSRADVDLYSAWFAGTMASRPGDASGTPLPVFEGRAGRVALLEEPDGGVGLRRGALRESVFDPDQPGRPSATEFALGYLPMLMHAPDPAVLVIGHGAGWTVEAVLAAGPRSLRVAELDGAVLDAARTYRGLKRLPVEVDERASLCACDGRILLRRATRHAEGKRFDVVVSQPSHPWTPASGHLFSTEAFTAGRDALNPGGVFAQWLNLFEMTPDLLRSSFASFRSVFPHVWVFRFSGELVLLGFLEAPVVDVARWEQGFTIDTAGGRMAHAAGFATAGSLWKHIALDTESLDRIVPKETATLQDDLPRLELGLAWRRLTLAAPEDAEAILMPGFPPRFEARLPERRARERWLAEAVNGWLDMGRPEEAEAWSRHVRWGQSRFGQIAHARAALAAHSPARALTALDAALRGAPEDGELAARWIAAVGETPPGTAEEETAARAKVDVLLGRFPDDGRVLAAAARLARARGVVEVAQQRFEQAVKAANPPAPAGTQAQLARLLLSQAFERDTLLRARTLLEEDRATFEDVDLLDQLMRIVSQLGEEEHAAALEASLHTLQQARGLSALREAAGHLSAHRFAEALAASQRAKEIWPTQATVFELDGLITLAALAAREAGRPLPPVALQDAVASFRDAIKRSQDPRRARERTGRMMHWYGHDPAALDGEEE